MRAPGLLLVAAVCIALPGGAQANRRTRPGEARLRDMRALRSAAKRHPYAGKIIRRALSDAPRTIESVGEVEADRIAERMGWVPLGADPELRKVTVAVVTRKVRQQSRGLRTLIARNPGQAAWDIVFIGAGVHTAIAANTVANLETDDPIRMLTIDGSNELGGTFRELGSTVARNSANRASEKGQRVRRGFGNKNESEGPWGDPDLDGQEYPEVGVLADTATVNLFASGSDFLLGSRVAEVEFRGDVAGSDGWPARYRVTMADGTAVYANAVARSTGLGRPKFGLTDQASLRLIRGERAKVDVSTPDEVPDLLHYIDAMRLANASPRGRDAYRAAPPRPRPFVELTGVRLRTSQPTTLRLSDSSELPIDQAIDVAFNQKLKRWDVRLLDGRRTRATRIAAEVGNREVTLQPGETLDDLARKLEALDLPDPVQVRRQPVKKKVRPPRFTPKQRLTEIRRLARYDLEELRIRPEGKALERASRIADVYRVREGVLRVVRVDGTSFRVNGPLRLYRPANGRFVTSIDPSAPMFDEPISSPRPVIAVIGGRDSGRTFLEYLYGQAPSSAYNGGGKIDSAQRGEVGDVEWYVGERGPADCAEFLDNTRSRYLRLAGKVRDAGDGLAPRAVLNKARVARVTRLQSGRYKITDSRGESRTVDKVIFATGFEGSVEEDGRVESIKGSVAGLDGDRVLAKRVRGRDIFRFGPAAGEDVVDADERYSTDENAGSLYAFGPRDRTFAQKVLASTVRTVARLDTPSLTRPARIALSKGQSDATIEPPRPSRRLETPLSDLVLRAELMDVLASVRGLQNRERISFRVVRDGKTMSIEALNHGGADKLAALISDSPLLYEQLEDATAEGQKVNVSVPLRRGVPLPARLTIAM